MKNKIKLNLIQIQFNYLRLWRKKCFGGGVTGGAFVIACFTLNKLKNSKTIAKTTNYKNHWFYISQRNNVLLKKCNSCTKLITF